MGFLLSVVVPCYNEEENIRAVFERVSAAVKQFDFELLFVNDGSRDNTAEEVRKIIELDGRVKLIDFTRNFGHEAATTAGVEIAKGDAVVILDADLQDPPELIPEMVKLWQEGNQVVYGQRENRKGESLLKKITAKLYYKILSKITDHPIPENTGDFRLMDRRVVDDFKKLHEKNRFFRGLVSWVGYKQTAIRFNRDKRNAGKTKYNYGKLVTLSLDSITSFSTKPLKWITFMGVVVAVLGFIAGIVFIVQKVFWNMSIEGWTSLAVIILFFSGFQIFLIGIVGEYIARMFIEVKDRPLYLVKEIVEKGKKENR